MTRRTRIILIFLAIILLLTPLTLYVAHFWRHDISNDTATWGHFGDYLNGTFMPIIAMSGVIVTLLLGLISDRRNRTNVSIEQQKQRPLLHIGYLDSENKIEIFMKNKGNGPLIIVNYRLVELNTNQQIEGIYNCLPSIERLFENYTGSQNNTVLSPNEVQELLLYEFQDGEQTAPFEEGKSLLRNALSVYKIVVDYNDVFDNRMPTYERSLAWFGRHEQN
ncbi:MAG: hypothetical protein ACRCSM_06455 [Sediminibacterium sp.]|jgi:hypothetical protein|nr:hypothetical protein [Chitinophagaceae bacterium]MCA6446587.1 hypothetical protein [Chitinophagaceae bacterium]